MASGILAEDWIAHHARFTPWAEAAHDLSSRRRFTYAQFDERIGRAARWLKAMRAAKFAAIQKIRGSRVIAVIAGRGARRPRGGVGRREHADEREPEADHGEQHRMPGPYRDAVDGHGAECREHTPAGHHPSVCKKRHRLAREPERFHTECHAVEPRGVRLSHIGGQRRTRYEVADGVVDRHLVSSGKQVNGHANHHPFVPVQTRRAWRVGPYRIMPTTEVPCDGGY